ncbi:MAG TPA: hypothetical protein VKA32_05780, partial [Gammaproteobacteria bacterium]|nr:hypothetical protein [Gammaproteobacteria bacterium]
MERASTHIAADYPDPFRVALLTNHCPYTRSNGRIHAVGDHFYGHAHPYRHTGRINSDMKNDAATRNPHERHKTSDWDSVQLLYLIIAPWALPNNDFPYGRT